MHQQVFDEMGWSVTRISPIATVAAGPQVGGLKILRIGAKNVAAVLGDAANGLSVLETRTTPAFTRKVIAITWLQSAQRFRAAKIGYVRQYLGEQRALILVENDVVPTENNRTFSRGEVVFVACAFIDRRSLVIFVCRSEVGLPMNRLGKRHWAYGDLGQFVPQCLE